MHSASAAVVAANLPFVPGGHTSPEARNAEFPANELRNSRYNDDAPVKHFVFWFLESENRPGTQGAHANTFAYVWVPTSPLNRPSGQSRQSAAAADVAERDKNACLPAGHVATTGVHALCALSATWPAPQTIQSLAPSLAWKVLRVQSKQEASIPVVAPALP